MGLIAGTCSAKVGSSVAVAVNELQVLLHCLAVPALDFDSVSVAIGLVGTPAINAQLINHVVKSCPMCLIRSVYTCFFPGKSEAITVKLETDLVEHATPGGAVLMVCLRLVDLTPRLTSRSQAVMHCSTAAESSPCRGI